MGREEYTGVSYSVRLGGKLFRGSESCTTRFEGIHDQLPWSRTSPAPNATATPPTQAPEGAVPSNSEGETQKHNQGGTIAGADTRVADRPQKSTRATELC
jgi:hypothetical protein